jgi:hypothetical protein
MKTFTTQFTLSRGYLAECFDQSLPHRKVSAIHTWFPVILLITGLVLLNLTDQPRYFGWMFLALAALELIHSRYRRAWWLARQTWGRNANAQVTLTINDEGVETLNHDTKTRLSWQEIDHIIETPLGLILVNVNGGQQYLSKSLFSEEYIALMISKTSK